MIDGVVLDTGFLISLVGRNRPCHETAKNYYKLFLENGVTMFLPTVVAAEFAIKQSIVDLPLRNFCVLPFNLNDATRCSDLNFAYYRNKEKIGQRDAVKDDFKIIAQTVEAKANILLTEDNQTLSKYAAALHDDRKVHFRVVHLKDGFDKSCINEDGQLEIFES